MASSDTSMTTRERVSAAMQHEEADRVPIWTLIDNAAILRRFAPDGIDMDALSRGEKRWRDLMELHKSSAAALGIDVIFLCCGNPANPFPRECAEHKSSATWDTEFVAPDKIRDCRLGEFDYDGWARGYVQLMRNAAEIMEPEVLVVDQMNTSLELLIGRLGLQGISLALHDAPGEVSRLLDDYSAHARRMAEVYADNALSFGYQVSGDIACKGRTLFSPDFLRKEMIPRLAYEIEPLKNAGIKVAYHSDGDVSAVINDLVEAGIDALNPIEPTAGMDIGAVKARFGDNLTLIGNVDPNIMTIGTPDEVERDVIRCLEQASAGGGHFVDTGAGELMPWFPAENCIRMCEAVHRRGRYR